MKRIKVILIAGALAVTSVGCAFGGEGASVASESEQTGAEAGGVAETSKSDAENAGSSEALDALIAGTGTVSFKYYMDNVYKEGEYQSDEDETVSHLSADKEYTLSDLKSAFNEMFGNEEYCYASGEVTSMEYAYLDCGADGEKELALRVQGPFVEPDSYMTYVIKEIDSKLQVVYAYAEWSRSATNMNEYGYITGGGSNGASNQGETAAYINADGKYAYGYYEEAEGDIDMFAALKDHDSYDTANLDGAICVYGLWLEPYNEENPDAQFYSYSVYDTQTYEETEVPNLYTDSKYKDVMDSFKGITFITMDELKKKEDEKLKSIGVTEEIKNGKELNYQEIKL